MKARILALAALELVLVGAGLLVIANQPMAMWVSGPGLFAAYALAMIGLAFLPRVYVEHRRHGCWITPTDFAILVGLFFLGPIGFIVAAMLAELAIAVRFRQSPLKTLFNLASGLGGYAAAATVFAVLGRADPLDPVAWLAGLAALAACSLWDVLSTSGVMAIAEDEPFSRSLRDNGPPLAISLVLSAMLGLPALILFSEAPAMVLLLAPVLAILLLSTRGVSHQRAERLRFQRLYEASSRLARLVSLRDTLSNVAEEARTLATGAAAICVVVHADGSREGVIVDDDGVADATATAIAQLTDLVRDGEQGLVAAGSLDAQARHRLPAFASMVWARKEVEPATEVVLAVFRELPPDEQDDYRSDVLAAFVSQAATVVANVELHEDVQRALGRQLELNRQKGEFVASVSHELRTPLASMLSAVQTIQRLGDRISSQERSRFLELGRSQGARLHALIEDLLLVAAADHRRVDCEKQPFDVSELFAALAEELGPTVEGRLTTEVHEGAERLVSDEDKVRRILINLVGNAGKYAPDGPIELEASRDGRTFVLSVTDHGPGIADGDRERVFERFVQLDQSSTRRQGGTGLGLHLSRQLTELLDGSLDLAEAPDGGARFELKLIVPTEDADDDRSDDRRTPSSLNGRARSPLVRPSGLEPTSRWDGRGDATSHRLATVGLEG